MSHSLTRADFCRLSLTGLLGAACQQKPSAEPPAKAGPAPVASAADTATAGAKAQTSTQRKLGATGEMVSMLGLGGAHIGKKEKLSDDEAIKLMRDAVEGGITFFDNCWDYNDGLSEERMGKALRDGFRQRVFLMTKLDGRTAKAANAQLEQSLKRLQTDRIDMVQVHEVIRMSDPERSFAPDGIMGALQAAKKAGKLRYIGFTGHKDPDIHLAMLEAAKKAGFQFDAVQLPLNVMDAHYKSFEAKVLPVLEQRGIGVLGMKSMGSGDILKAGVVKAEECLRYALSLPTSVVITGIDSREVLEQDLKLMRDFVPYTGKEREALLARTAPAAAKGEHELFKTSDKYDGTAKNPKWLETAEL
ncbi:MAG: Nucleoside-diphosphate-sugar epimerase [Polyangiaceae bacterium]|jgi:aryl-alcohol dehydrogenase-like predicted oxidoreductase|nr:Nucleoside-diphosphate-sugar epimerase [Polyangiaceae bacterium]